MIVHTGLVVSYLRKYISVIAYTKKQNFLRMKMTGGKKYDKSCERGLYYQ